MRRRCTEHAVGADLEDLDGVARTLARVGAEQRRARMVDDEDEGAPVRRDPQADAVRVEGRVRLRREVARRQPAGELVAEDGAGDRLAGQGRAAVVRRDVGRPGARMEGDVLGADHARHALARPGEVRLDRSDLPRLHIDVEDVAADAEQQHEQDDQRDLELAGHARSSTAGGRGGPSVHGGPGSDQPSRRSSLARDQVSLASIAWKRGSSRSWS